ncbi:MAG: clostripain-related cysteine peptidase [Clostridia bacterium]|nr:clostripain-related cysteine peptidase [Clostridia bacterium]
MFCNFCGTPIPDGALKCPACNAEVNAGSNVESEKNLNDVPELMPVPEVEKENASEAESTSVESVETSSVSVIPTTTETASVPVAEPTDADKFKPNDGAVQVPVSAKVADITAPAAREVKASSVNDIKKAEAKPKKAKKKKGKRIFAVIATILALLIVGGGALYAVSMYQESNRTTGSSHHSGKAGKDKKDKKNKKGDPTPTPEPLPTDEPAATATATPIPEATSAVTPTPVVNANGDYTWTIMIYMCGSDLEAGNAIASMVLDQYDDLNPSDNINIVVETGGTTAWNNDDSYFSGDAVQGVDIPDDALGRYQIKHNEIIDLGSVPLDSMGKASTLSDFISWGSEQFPADRYMFVMWNHGYVEPYGCLECDQLFYTDDNGEVYYYKDPGSEDAFYNDCLDLDELSQGLKDGGVHFELFALNTCLSASMEIATVVAPYANAMVGSEESVPAAIGIPLEYVSYINENSAIDGFSLGKMICDDYQEYIDEILDYLNGDDSGNAGMFSKSNLSVINLSAVGEMKDCYDDVMRDVYYSVYSDDAYTGILDAASKCENYGSEGVTEGNLIDLRSFLKNASPYLIDTESDEKLMNLIADNIYVKNGPARVQSSGLSFFFPSYNYLNNLKAEIEGEALAAGVDLTDDEMEMVLAEYISHSMSVYETNIHNDSDYFWYASYLGYRFADYWQPSADAQNRLAQALDSGYTDAETINDSEHGVTFSTHIDDEYNFVLDVTEGANSVISVEMNYTMHNVVESSNTDTGYFDNYTYFGATRRDIVADVANGTWSNYFKCDWFYYGDYPVPVYCIEETDDHTLYGFQATVNGYDAIIVFEHVKATDECQILYVMKVNQIEGVASNDYYQLQEGDEIGVMFFSFIPDFPYGNDMYEDTLFIRPFYKRTYSLSDKITVGPTYSSGAKMDFIANYTITDAYGNTYNTDFVRYNVENGIIVSVEEVSIDDIPASVYEELYGLV